MNRISVRDTMWLPRAGLAPTIPTESKRMMCACRRCSILVTIINKKHRVQHIEIEIREGALTMTVER